MAILLVVSAGHLAVFAAVVNFPDPGLEQAIRDAIGKPTGDIHDTDLVGLTDLHPGTFPQITNLEGLQYCTDLVTLNLDGHNITDLTPLAPLTNLEELRFVDNTVASVAPLAGLVNLTYLDLAENRISDISPLVALVNLTTFSAYDNRIADISVLAGMTGLTSVSLFENAITDITPLAGLANLSILTLGVNQISDISPLAGMTGLTQLRLDNNPIADFSPLTGLLSLAALLLDQVRLYDLEPLILNPGLGAWDTIWVRYNHLCLSPGSEDQLDVDTLVARGATVLTDPQLFCPDSAASFRVFWLGDVEIDQTLRAKAFASGAADVAEWVRVSERVSPGDVVTHDPSGASTYRLSREACSPLIGGVISPEPGMILGQGEVFDRQALLALAGIVSVKVTDEGGPIESGDLLVSSSTPGHAMRWAGPERCSCSLVGKALEPLVDGTGVILVLLTAH